MMRTVILVLVAAEALAGCVSSDDGDSAASGGESALRDDSSGAEGLPEPHRFPGGTVAAYDYTAGNASWRISIAAANGPPQMLANGRWVETHVLTSNGSFLSNNRLVDPQRGVAYFVSEDTGEFVAELISGPRDAPGLTEPVYRLYHHGFRDSRSIPFKDPVVSALVVAWLSPGLYGWSSGGLNVSATQDGLQGVMISSGGAWQVAMSELDQHGWPANVTFTSYPQGMGREGHVSSLQLRSVDGEPNYDSSNNLLTPPDLMFTRQPDQWQTLDRADGARLWYPKFLETRQDLMLILAAMLEESLTSLEVDDIALSEADWSPDWAPLINSSADPVFAVGAWEGAWRVELAALDDSQLTAPAVVQTWISRTNPEPTAAPAGPMHDSLTVVESDREVLGDSIHSPVALINLTSEVFEGPLDWFAWRWDFFGAAQQEAGYFLGYGCFPHDDGEATVIFMDAVSADIPRYFWREPYSGPGACSPGYERPG